MKRGPLFLAAALVEVLRFFVLMIFAAALGLLTQHQLIPYFLRYLAVGQLLFAAAYFFLWLDGERYAVYRPLALAGKAVSLLAFSPLLIALLGSGGGEGYLLAGGTARYAAAFLPLADLLGILLLALYRRPGAPAADKPPLELAQRGPEDIERVESLP